MGFHNRDIRRICFENDKKINFMDIGSGNGQQHGSVCRGT